MQHGQQKQLLQQQQILSQNTEDAPHNRLKNKHLETSSHADSSQELDEGKENGNAHYNYNNDDRKIEANKIENANKITKENPVKKLQKDVPKQGAVKNNSMAMSKERKNVTINDINISKKPAPIKISLTQNNGHKILGHSADAEDKGESVEDALIKVSELEGYDLKGIIHIYLLFKLLLGLV